MAALLRCHGSVGGSNFRFLTSFSIQYCIAQENVGVFCLLAMNFAGRAESLHGSSAEHAVPPALLRDSRPPAFQAQGKVISNLQWLYTVSSLASARVLQMVPGTVASRVQALCRKRPSTVKQRAASYWFALFLLRKDSRFMMTSSFEGCCPS